MTVQEGKGNQVNKITLSLLFLCLPACANQAHPHDIQIRKKVELTEKILTDTYSNAKPFTPALAIVTIALDMYQSAKNTLKLQLVIATLEESLTQLLTALAYHRPHQEALRAYCKTAHEQTIIIEELILSELPAKERRQLMRTLRSVQKRVIPFAVPAAFAGATKYIGGVVAVAGIAFILHTIYSSIIHAPINKVIKEEKEKLTADKARVNNLKEKVRKAFPKKKFLKKRRSFLGNKEKERRADYLTSRTTWERTKEIDPHDKFANALNLFLGEKSRK
jgi:cell division protein FtsL